MEANGEIERDTKRRVAPPSALPEVTVLEISGIDTDGEVLACPLSWDGEGVAPRIEMQPEKRGQPALGVGERVLARLQRLSDGLYQARTIRRLHKESAPARIVGIYDGTAEGGRISPTDRRDKDEYLVRGGDSGGADSGELVLAEVLPSTRLGLKPARVVERLGSVADPRAISLIAIKANDLPTVFSAAAVAEAERAKPPTLEGRVDLRAVPLVTIDGEDARDFDDAVFAQADADEDNPGGWHLIVAIADVSAYVTPGSALDRAAYERGNSAYFPDRVIPMLPEALSNELCSLKPAVDRACLAAHLWLSRDGELIRHQFVRGLMRSVARLTYTQVQEAVDGTPNELTTPLLEPIIRPLYGAYKALDKARLKRGTLDLDLPERQVKLGEGATIASITARPRYDSHKLIEEFMICANVAAALALEAKRQPCMYRVHDVPSATKLESLREFLGSIGQKLAKGQVLQPRHFARILENVAGTAESPLVNQVILRSQAQAIYTPENIGHFGLALPRYAHFTSPIRRYADLLVHRALIRGYDLGPGSLSDGEAARFEAIGEHISMTERRAATAERDATDRYVAAYLAEHVGAVFPGRIGGVARFGLFITLDETGADGMIPISTLPDDFYLHDENLHTLTGRQHGRTFRLGMKVKVRLIEADAIAGSTLFGLVEAEGEAVAENAGRRGRRGDDRPRRFPGKVKPGSATERPKGKHRRKR